MQIYPPDTHLSYFCIYIDLYPNTSWVRVRPLAYFYLIKMYFPLIETCPDPLHKNAKLFELVTYPVHPEVQRLRSKHYAYVIST